MRRGEVAGEIGKGPVGRGPFFAPNRIAGVIRGKRGPNQGTEQGNNKTQVHGQGAGELPTPQGVQKNQRPRGGGGARRDAGRGGHPVETWPTENRPGGRGNHHNAGTGTGHDESQPRKPLVRHTAGRARVRPPFGAGNRDEGPCPAGQFLSARKGAPGPGRHCLRVKQLWGGSRGPWGWARGGAGPARPFLEETSIGGGGTPNGEPTATAV